jgi:hypothetical protein
MDNAVLSVCVLQSNADNAVLSICMHDDAIMRGQSNDDTHACLQCDGTWIK